MDIRQKAKAVLTLVRAAGIEGTDLISLRRAEAETDFIENLPNFRLGFENADVNPRRSSGVVRVCLDVFFVEKDGNLLVETELAWSSYGYPATKALAALAYYAKVIALAERIEAL